MRPSRWATALCAALLTACTSASTGHDALDTAARFLDAAANGDTSSACALLTPRTRDEIAFTAGQSCEQALPAGRLGGTVRDSDVWSDEARVTTDQGTVYLSGFDSGWLIAAAGCLDDGDEPDRCVVG